MKRAFIAFLFVVSAAADPQFFGFKAPSLAGEAAKQLGGQFTQLTQVAQQTVNSALPALTKNLPKQFSDLIIQANDDCGCSGYETFARKCNWREQQCNLLSSSFLNFAFWCHSINRFRDAKRLGLIRNTYEKKLSCQSNLSLLEREATQLGLKEPADSIKPEPLPDDALPTSDVAVPSSINWSSEMSTVRNQGECASCYAFASVAMCEWYLAKSGKNVTLSEQYLVDCNELDKGCNGGWPKKTLSVMEKGVAPGSYEYVARLSTCETNHDTSIKCPKAVQEHYPKGNDTRLRQLLARGPVVGSLHVNEDFFEYADGLYTTSNCTGKLNHAVVITGYGEETGEEENRKYWIVRNSWGEEWGTEGGYAYIDASIENICNLSKWFWYYSD